MSLSLDKQLWFYYQNTLMATDGSRRFDGFPLHRPFVLSPVTSKQNEKLSSLAVRRGRRDRSSWRHWGGHRWRWTAEHSVWCVGEWRLPVEQGGLSPSADATPAPVWVWEPPPPLPPNFLLSPSVPPRAVTDGRALLSVSPQNVVRWFARVNISLDSERPR